MTVFDPNEAGAAGASSVAAGLLHPLTPRGKLIWKGEEGFKAAKHLIEVRTWRDRAATAVNPASFAFLVALGTDVHTPC